MALHSANFAGGEQAVLYYEAETNAGGYPHSTSTLPAATGTPLLAGYFKPANRTHNDNNSKGFSGGSPFSTYDKKGRREYGLRADIIVGNIALLQKCLRGSGGYKNLADLALYAGASNEYSDGYMDVLREAKCSQLVLNLQEDAEVIGQAEFWAMCMQSATNASPTNSAIKTAGGDALFWYDMSAWNIGSTNFRNVISGANLTLNHNLKRIGQRPNGGDNSVLSRCCWAIRPGKVMGTGSFTLKDRLPASLFNSGADSTNWGNITALIGTAGKTFNLTFTNARYQQEERQGGDVDGELLSSVNFVYDDLEIATA